MLHLRALRTSHHYCDMFQQNSENIKGGLRVVVPLIRVADQKGKEHDELNVACNSGKEALLHLPHIQMMLCRR